MAITPTELVAIRKIFGPETFFAIDVHCPPGGLVFRGNLRGPPGPTVDALNRRLETVLGHDRYTACLVQGDEPVAAATAPGRVVPAPGGATKPMVLIVPSRRAMQGAVGGGVRLRSALLAAASLMTLYMGVVWCHVPVVAELASTAAPAAPAAAAAAPPTRWGLRVGGGAPPASPSAPTGATTAAAAATARSRRPVVLVTSPITPLAFFRTAVGTAARRPASVAALFASGGVSTAAAPAVRVAVLAQARAVATATVGAAALLAAAIASQRAMADRARVVIGPPSLLPIPGGTLGALSWLASPPPDRPSLVRIAAAGSGFLLVASAVVFLVGVALSVVPPTTPALLGGYPTALAVPSMGFLRLPLSRGSLASSLLPGGLLAALARAGRLHLLPPPPARAAAAVAAGATVSAGGAAAAAAAAAAPSPVLLVHGLVVAGLVGLRAAGAGLLILRGTDGGRLVRGVYGRRTAAAAQRVTVVGLLAGVVAFQVTWPLWLLVMLVLWGGGGMSVRTSRNGGGSAGGAGAVGASAASASATTTIGSAPVPPPPSSSAGRDGAGGGAANASGKRARVLRVGGARGGSSRGGDGGGTTAVQVADRPCRNECSEPSDAAAVGVYVLLLAMLGLVLPLPPAWLPFPGP